MRVLLLTHYFPPEIGAPQRRWRELVAGFTGAGHQVAVCAPVPHYPHRSATALKAANTKTMKWGDGQNGERVLRVPYLPTSSSMPGQLLDQSVSSLYAFRVAAAMRRDAPDVVISTTPGIPMLFAGDSVARYLGIPHVAEIRDAWPDLIADSHLVRTATRGVLPEQVNSYLEQKALPAVFHAALRRASRIVVTTDGFRTRLAGCGHSAVTVVRNTAVPYRPSKQENQRASRDSLRLLYVGTVGRSQGLESIVRVVGAVPGVHLKIVGAGAAHRGLQRSAAEVLARTDGLTGGGRIQFLPQTTGDELESLWRWADSGVVSLTGLPSFEYTVPSKLYTIMARGVHITGVLSGEAAQIVTDAGAGHVVSPGDIDGLHDLLIDLRDGAADLTPSPRAQDWLATHAAPEIALGAYLDVLEGVR